MAASGPDDLYLSGGDVFASSDGDLPQSDPVTMYWGGGTANWTGTDSWFDNPGLSGTGQIWQDGWHAVIAAGDVALNASVITEDLQLAEGARLRIGGNNQVLTITGQTTGSGTVRFDRTNGGNISGLRFANDTAQTVGWDFLLNQNESRVRLEIAGSATLTLDGTMQAWGNAFDIVQEPGSHVIIGPNARINNNRPDLINARPFAVWPADATAIFEMHPDFDVDLADPGVLENTYPFAKPEDDPGDGFYVKPVGGLSTWRTVSGTTITHATPNLASIHKYTGGDKRYTHHGLWNFEGTGSEPDPVWIVRTNPQSYDGGIYFVRDWTLHTEADFTFEGLWHDGVNIGFSTRSGEQNITFTKTGPADFIIKGTQAYGEGSVMRVEEGGVRFHTDPMVGAVPKAGNGWFNNTGDYLNLEVHAGAEVSFLPPAGETFHLASADVSGSLILHYTGVPALAVSGDLTLPGLLVLETDLELNGESFLIATASGQIDVSSASFVVPTGWEVVVVGEEILLQPVSGDAYANWVALHGISGGPADLTNGMANLLRYALGGDATIPPKDLRPDFSTGEVAEGILLELTFHRIDDPLVHYAVWYSNNLVDWGSEPVWQDYGAEENEAGPFMVVHPSGGERGFLRLVVTRSGL